MKKQQMKQRLEVLERSNRWALLELIKKNDRILELTFENERLQNKLSVIENALDG